MLAKSGPLPEGPDWRFELKADGFRALVSTTGGLRVRSRRGWRMEHLLPELADLPPRLMLDGELIARGDDKLPSFPRLCERMLHGRRGIPIAYTIIDVLEWDGHGLLNWPYRQRRQLLEDLELHGSNLGHGDVTRGWEAALQDGMRPRAEGVVAKKLWQRYRPGERLWIKVKNREYWRWPLERSQLIRSRERVPI
jgi:bifunctional non-homologous end joining protein LigD